MGHKITKLPKVKSMGHNGFRCINHAGVCSSFLRNCLDKKGDKEDEEEHEFWGIFDIFEINATDCLTTCNFLMYVCSIRGGQHTDLYVIHSAFPCFSKGRQNSSNEDFPGVFELEKHLSVAMHPSSRCIIVCCCHQAVQEIHKVLL